MSSYITKPSKDFISNIEDAIKEYGVITCPNPSCNKKLISKKKIDVNNNAFLEYGCQDPSCFYHKKRKISIPIEEVALGDKSSSLFKNISYSKILYFSLFALLCITGYTSYHVYNINQFMESDIANESKIDELQNQIDTELRSIKKSSSSITSTTNTKNKNLSIAALVTQTKTWISSGNFKQGKANFKKLLDNKSYRTALLDNKNQNLRYELLELIGDSYEKSKPQFSYNFLKDRNSFNLLENFINTFDTEKKVANVYLGRAYLNFPNILIEKIGSEERKKMQLTALNYYLNAAKKDQLGKYHKSSIKEVNEICKTYRLYSYSAKKPKNYIPTEKIILQKKKDVLQNRINFVEQIIKNIS